MPIVKVTLVMMFFYACFLILFHTSMCFDKRKPKCTNVVGSHLRLSLRHICELNFSFFVFPNRLEEEEEDKTFRASAFLLTP